MPRIPPSLCARCKGYKKLCGLPRCPILERFQAQLRASLTLSDNTLAGFTPPAALVGEHGYPHVRVYYMVPPGEDEEEARYHEAPRLWAVNKESLSRIIQLRSSMIAATLRVHARDPFKLYEKEILTASLSLKPVDSEIELMRPPTPRLIFDGISKPVGPGSPAKRIKIAGNPLLHRKLESIIWDDVPAHIAVAELYRAGIDVYTIQKAFSLGALGRTNARRVVPTRWAITAIDDILSKYIREFLKDKPELDGVELYKAEYLGNRFFIILYPGPGSFEWVEIWHPAGLWTRGARSPITWRVSEDPRGRVSEIDGGFSAARFSVLEALSARGRRADVVILREILPEYYAPVGNWHIRETVRRALTSSPARFDTLREAIAEALNSLREPEAAMKTSPLLRGLRTRRLTEYWPDLV